MKNIDLLQKCGFNMYESKILLTLSDYGAMTIPEIGFKAKVPKNKAYEILNYLKKKGVVELLLTKPKKYGVVNLKQTLEKKMTSRKKELDFIERELKEMKVKDKSIEDTFWMMQGESAMINKIVNALEDVKEESIGFIDIWTAKTINLQMVKKAIDRGVKFYFLGTINEKTKPLAKKYAKLGVRIKHHSISGAGYSVFDNKYVQLRISEEEVLTMWIENSNFANILREHFFKLWKEAKEVKL